MIGGNKNIGRAWFNLQGLANASLTIGRTWQTLEQSTYFEPKYM
jgi:hypothetical protein